MIVCARSHKLPLKCNHRLSLHLKINRCCAVRTKIFSFDFDEKQQTHWRLIFTWMVEGNWICGATICGNYVFCFHHRPLSIWSISSFRTSENQFSLRRMQQMCVWRYFKMPNNTRRTSLSPCHSHSQVLRFMAECLPRQSPLTIWRRLALFTWFFLSEHSFGSVLQIIAHFQL